MAFDLPGESSETERDTRDGQYARLREQLQQLDATFALFERLSESVHDTACATVENMRA